LLYLKKVEISYDYHLLSFLMWQGTVVYLINQSIVSGLKRDKKSFPTTLQIKKDRTKK